MKWGHFLFALALLLPAAYAAEQPALVYSRTTIRIIPKSDEKMVQAEEKKNPANKPEEVLPVLPRVAKEFTVEVRPLSFLAQRDFIAHQPFTDKEGMLFLIDPPQTAALSSANLLAKVDVLFVREDGFIAKIVPSLALPTLAEPIDSQTPIHAFIFLKAGMAESSDIKPGDHIQSALFTPRPVILEAVPPK